MKPKRYTHLKTLLFVWIAFLMLSGLVHAREINSDAATPGMETSAGGWHFTIAFPMVWAPSIKGEIEGGGDRIDFKIPFGDILEDLSFGILGEVYASRGPWSFALKVNYLDTEDETVTQGLTSPVWGIPIAPRHKIEASLRMAANDLLVRYQVHDKLLLSTGVRHVHSKLDLDITALGTGLVAINKKVNVADDNLFDWLVGAAFVHWFSDRWGIKVNGDFAVAGDNDRNYSANGMILYRITK